MRTTVDLPEALLRQAKQHAAKAGVTLAALIEDALMEKLHRRSVSKTDAAFVFPVYRGPAGAKTGVDLRSNRKVLDLLDADE